jgi:hypothetical protein
MGVARTASRHAAPGAFGNAIPYLFDEGALRRAAAGLDALALPAQARRKLS